MIDDDIKLCRLVKDYLAPLGFEIEAAHHGFDGLEKIKSSEFDAVILDVMSFATLFDTLPMPEK